MSHTRGNYTVVYPVMRGTAPILQSLRRICFCGDAFNAKQWTGVAILLGGILSLAAYNIMYIKNARDKLSMAAVVCRCNGRVRHPLHGLLAYDAWGIRQATNSFFLSSGSLSSMVLLFHLLFFQVALHRQPSGCWSADTSWCGRWNYCYFQFWLNNDGNSSGQSR